MSKLPRCIYILYRSLIRSSLDGHKRIQLCTIIQINAFFCRFRTIPSLYFLILKFSSLYYCLTYNLKSMHVRLGETPHKFTYKPLSKHTHCNNEQWRYFVLYVFTTLSQILYHHDEWSKEECKYILVRIGFVHGFFYQQPYTYKNYHATNKLKFYLLSRTWVSSSQLWYKWIKHYSTKTI